MRIEPPVSVPIEAIDMPVFTAMPDPPLEPPGERVSSTGWRASPKPESSVVVPNANSCRLVRPTITAPARLSRAVTGASVAATTSRRTREPAVLGRPAWSKMSLSEIGIPCSGPTRSPFARV